MTYDKGGADGRIVEELAGGRAAEGHNFRRTGGEHRRAGGEI